MKGLKNDISEIKHDIAFIKNNMEIKANKNPRNYLKKKTKRKKTNIILLIN